MKNVYTLYHGRSTDKQEVHPQLESLEAVGYYKTFKRNYRYKGEYKCQKKSNLKAL